MAIHGQTLPIPVESRFVRLLLFVENAAKSGILYPIIWRHSLLRALAETGNAAVFFVRLIDLSDLVLRGAPPP